MSHTKNLKLILQSKKLSELPTHRKSINMTIPVRALRCPIWLWPTYDAQTIPWKKKKKSEQHELWASVYNRTIGKLQLNKLTFIDLCDCFSNPTLLSNLFAAFSGYYPIEVTIMSRKV